VGDVPEPEPGCPGVMIRALSFAATEADLQAAFQACGKGPSRVRLLRDKATGESKGKAFVDFDEDLEGSKAAVRKNGQDLKGRRMTIEYARARAS